MLTQVLTNRRFLSISRAHARALFRSVIIFWEEEEEKFSLKKLLSLSTFMLLYLHVEGEKKRMCVLVTEIVGVFFFPPSPSFVDSLDFFSAE